MTLSHRKDEIEHGAKWIAALVVEELAKRFVRAGLAWAKGRLQRLWAIFLRSKATMLEQTFEGRISILRLAPAAYDVTFAPYFGAGALQAHRCGSDSELQSYLQPIVAWKDKIWSALTSLREKGSARIDNIVLTDEQVLRHGLDSTPLRQAREQRGL
jgi:hypothetical protein